MGDFFTEVIQKDPRFHSNERISDVALLEPEIQRKVQAMVADAKGQGVEVMIFETYRSVQRQELLFEQGATQLRTVGVHHYGLACDLVRVVNGEPNWDVNYWLLGFHRNRATRGERSYGKP